jgi:hypothetical protein
MFKKTFLFSAATVLVAMMSAATASALLDTWNRPNPLMDYVSQEMGMYDTTYDLLTDTDCRGCHGDNLADRHHYSPLGLAGQCDGCHDIISEPPGVFPVRDCTTGGCHSWDDVYANGWHHDTDLSAAENCVICHSPNLVAPIGPFTSFQEYPPSVVTPTPFSCENCHWGQSVVDAHALFDGTISTQALAGHPSSFDHYNEWGDFVGYYEYKREIFGNHDTHHLGFTDCSACHSVDPNDSSWDPDDPELIRYCETCHSVGTLLRIFPHVGPPGTGGGPAAEGWEAVGFHVGGSSSDLPIVYRGDNADGFSTNPVESFEANEMCFGCHEPLPPYDSRECSPGIRINPRGIVPAAGQAISLVELTGECFGDTYGEGRAVQLKRRVDGAEWIDMPISSWADDRIVFEIPCGTLTPGNYWVRVHNEGSTGSNHYSNQVVFTFAGDG